MVEPAMEKRGHETRDINVRVVAWFAIGMVAAAIVIYPAIVGFYKILERHYPSPDSPSRIALDPQMIAPAPRLQVLVTADLDKFIAAENARLNSYGWIDESAGVAHIPIERAMDLIAERGLPTRGPGTQNASGVTPEKMQERKAAATK